MGEATGAVKEITYAGHRLLFRNQRSKEWAYPYDHITAPGDTLSSAGCGLFSLCHCVEWMHGMRLDPCRLSDFAREKGGRGEDGTDRPAFLHALTVHGEAARMGFRYEEDGLRNDLESLWDHLAKGRGAALCNLRAGHIVALVDSRIFKGERQLLAVDSHSESASEKVRDAVREVVPGSEIITPVRNQAGLVVGQALQYGMFWVSAGLPRDFNLLHQVRPQA